LEPEELVDVIVNRIFADAERGDEVKVQLLSRISESGNGRVDPNRVASAFESIIAEQEAGYEGDPHKAPVRAQRLWKVFKGRENETIYLEDFVPVFHGTENPRKNAVNAITWIRPFLQEKSFDIVRKRLHKSATYRLVPFVSERVD
jgi:hypothetical protein